MGGTHPVRIQSMCNTDTMELESTLNQCSSLIEAGCELIRITAQGLREANQLEKIKNELIKRGHEVPLIADIHFNPKAAELAAGIVEKIRINPGNYVDRKGNTPKVYSDSEYREELDRIAERMQALISICKKNNTAIRIGVNHGSLSERIMNRYGDTPAGMVESAIEFASICAQQGFEKLVLSMKSSDVKQMIYANRLLIQRMIREGMDYPIHLGVTEAGDGEDGRIKSAAGIGALLADGIGDTIRVSLTEDPVAEIPVARMISSQFADRRQAGRIEDKTDVLSLPTSYKRHSKDSVQGIGADHVPAVSDELSEDIVGSGQLNIIQVEMPSHLDEVKNDPRPLILRINAGGHSIDEIIVNSSSTLAKCMVDGYGDGIWIDANVEAKRLNEIELGILQALHLRISKTEYIACPSCGRTQFNLQEVLDKIRQKTAHLKGLKIGVMGCIVNGPGEMADAHYGYVGSGKGKITLYKGQEVIKKNIDENLALDTLISLIKENGDYIDL